MEALYDLVSSVTPDACTPSAAPLPTTDVYSGIAPSVAATQTVIADADSIVAVLGEQPLTVAALVEELWARTVGVAHHGPLVSRCIVVFGGTTGTIGRHDMAVVRAEFIAHARSGLAPVGRLTVVIHGATPQPMCLRPREHALEWDAAEPALGAGDADTAIAAWVHARAGDNVLVETRSPAVLAALLVTSALGGGSTTRGQLLLSRPFVAGIGGVRALAVPQYINVHMATMNLEVIFGTRIAAHGLVARRTLVVPLIVMAALCIDGVRLAAPLGDALSRVCVAARERRLGEALDVVGGSVTVRTDALRALLGAMEPAPAAARSDEVVAAQAARATHALARLINAGNPAWRAPDARAVNVRTRRSLWGYAADGTPTNVVEAQPVYVCT